MPQTDPLAQLLLEEIRKSREQHSAEIRLLREELHTHLIGYAGDHSEARQRLDVIEGGMDRHRDEHKIHDATLHRLKNSSPNGAKALATLLAAIAALVAALASLWTSLHP